MYGGISISWPLDLQKHERARRRGRKIEDGDKKTGATSAKQLPPRTTPLDWSSSATDHLAHAVYSRYLNNDGFQHAQNRNASLAVRSNLCEKEVAFTWVGRLFADTLIILFVASFGLPGKIMAIVTLFFFLVTLGIAKHRPDIFRDLFRAHEQDPSLGESYNVAP
eukprot:scaffold15019_cov130-Skeletonema_dohrnii-CCMP3373.AAC.6